VRLTNGTENYGRLEVYHDGVWGSICDALIFADLEAVVFCRQLHFP